MAIREASPLGHHSTLPADGGRRVPSMSQESGPPEPPKPRLLDCVRHAIDATGQHGVVRKLDRGHGFEWRIQQDDLQAVGLSVHHLAMTPEHEYTILETESRSVASIQIRMADVSEWL